MEKTIHKQLSKYKHCDKVTGKETLDDLATLLFTPQGIEFCIDNKFPNIDDVRKLDKDFCKRHNIVVDDYFEGENINRIAVFGKSNVVLRFNNLDCSYHILAMHGARVKVVAENYAVVFINSRDADIIIDKRDNAKVFIDEWKIPN
jgi:hypothetical protein